MGNPHGVVFVDSVADIDIEKIGPKFENHPMFPDRVNTESVSYTHLDVYKRQLLSHMRGQAEIAMETADVIIFLTDVRQGLVDADYQVADMLRRSGKPIVLAVNKVDNYEKFVLDTYEFYNLGLGTPFPVSANSKIGFGDLLDEVLVHCNPQDADEKEDERPRVAIIGKPNAGKSSLINKLLGEDRLIVSDIAGTTRDAIDTTVKRNGKEYVFIDTAGLRKKARVKEDIERYSVIRTVAAVERCDCLLYTSRCV